MSDIQFNQHDQQVFAQLEQLDERTTAGEYFARALELDATPVLLAQIASTYLQRGPDGYKIVGLPYMQDMLDADRDPAEVRTVLGILCFNELQYEICGSHRDGFWNDPNTWDVFDGDTFVAFMQKLAATYEGTRRVLTEDGHNLLESALVMWRDTPQEYQRDVCAIEAVAARHLTFIEDEYQLKQMIRYGIVGRDERATHRRLSTMAQNVANWGWNLVFKGYVLAKLPAYGSESGYVRGGIQSFLNSRPELAPVMLRWLLEGFRREHNEFWWLKFNDKHIMSLFGGNLHHLRVQRTMAGQLQVVMDHKGRRIVIRHVPGSEEITLGDEVMISHKQIEDQQPSTTPEGQAHKLTLIPVRPPTPAQLADVRGQFPTKKK